MPESIHRKNKKVKKRSPKKEGKGANPSAKPKSKPCSSCCLNMINNLHLPQRYSLCHEAECLKELQDELFTTSRNQIVCNKM